MDNEGEIDMDPTEGCNPTRSEKEKLEEKLASLFITKFVTLYLVKFVQYSKLCDGTLCKDKPLVRTIGGIVGAILGGGSSILLGLSPASGFKSASAGASVGSLGAAALDKKYRTKPKAKFVTAKITTAYNSSTDEIYSPRAQKRFLTSVLIEGAAQIFHTFQTQITQIWHAAEKQEADRTLTKVALDAVARSIDYICVNTQNETFSADTVCAGVLHGSSKKSLTAKLSFTMLGYKGYNFKVNNSKWNTSEMFKGTAVMVKGREQENDNVLYIKNKEKYGKYGFRIWSNCEDEESQNLFLRSLENAGYIPEIVPKAENTFSSYISQKQLDWVVGNVLKGFEDEDYTLRFDSIDETIKAILMEVGESHENIIEGQMMVLENQMSNHEEVLANLKKLQDRPSCEPRLTTFYFPATPERDLSFVGRMKITESVIAALMPFETSKVFPFVNLHALGGFGKTQLARNVVQEIKARKLFEYHIWIDSETEDAIIKDFGILVKCMKQESDPDLNHTIFYNSLKDHKMLIVFDNVDNLDVLKKYLPHDYEMENTSVLVTSRMKLDGGVTASIIAIPVPRFEDDDSLLLINTKLTSKEENSDLKKLISESDGIPLILHIMCSTILFFRRINGQQYTIQDYLNEHAETSFLYGDEGDTLSFNFNYDRSLRKSVEIAVNYLRKDNGRIGKLAVTIFDRIAYLSPDGVSLEYLLELPDISSEAKTMGGESIPKLNLDESIECATELLEQFGIVTRNKEMSLTIHRSLQFVRRIALKKEEVHILQSLGQSLPNLYSMPTVSHVRDDNRRTNFIALWNHLSKDKYLITRFYPLKATFMQLAFYKSEEGLRNMFVAFGLDTAIQYILGEIHFRICNYCPIQEKCPTPSIFEMIHRFKREEQLTLINSAHQNYTTMIELMEFLEQSLQKVYPLNFKERFLSCSTSDCCKPRDNMFLVAAANSLRATPVEYVMTEMVHNTAFLAFSLQDNWKTIFNKLPNFDVNVKDPYGETVLFHILDGENIESESLAKRLLEKGANPGIANVNGFNALHVAASRGKCDAVQAILQRRTDLLESKTSAEETPLHLAISHLQTAQMILKFGANVNAKDQKVATPLMKAVEVCAAEVVKLFLDNNADLNIITTDGSRIPAIHLYVEVEPESHNPNLKEIINIFLHHYDGADLQDAGGTVSHLLLELFFQVIIPPRHTLVTEYRMRFEVEKCSMHRKIPNEECLNTLDYWKRCNLDLENFFTKIKSESPQCILI